MKRYQSILFAAFLVLAVVGGVGLNIVPTNIDRTSHVVMTSDGVSISFDLYYKAPLSSPEPVIVIGHGIIVNKEMMTDIAIELAEHGFIVASLDWRSHGQSGGTLVIARLIYDLDAVIAAIPTLIPYTNMSAIGLIGYSMGGWPTYDYATNHTSVKAWIAVASSPSGTGNTTSPANVLVIHGAEDEAFSQQTVIANLSKITTTSEGLPAGQKVVPGTLYGNISNGTARELIVLPFADHLSTPWDRRSVALVTSWMVRTFYGVTPNTSVMAYDGRLALLIVGTIGLVGTVYGFSMYVAGIPSIKRRLQVREGGTIPQAMIDTTRPATFVASYFGWMFLLIPTAALPALLFLTPEFFTAFLTLLAATLAINMLLAIWHWFRKNGQGVAYRNFLKANLLAPGGTWMIGILCAVAFEVGFYAIIGLNYLGTIPAAQKVPYLFLYGPITFFTFYVFGIFVQKIVMPIVEAKTRIKKPAILFVVQGLVSYVLVFAWFTIIIMVPCMILGNYFLALIVIITAPIMLFATFAGVHLEKVTGSPVPLALIMGVFLTLLTLTLSWVGSISVVGFF
jgi:dienelactone hydrolase